MSEAIAGCPGKKRVVGTGIGLCIGCALQHNGATAIDPAASIGEHGAWECVNRQWAGAVLTPEQVAAVDETAGLR